MMTRLKIGVMGCGSVAQAAHLPILKQMSEVEVIAAEADAARRDQIAQQFPNLRIVSDYRDLLADVQAVVVTLPSQMHAEAATVAFEAGKHVYLEKPVAADLRGAHDVLEAWRRAGTVGMMGFNYRYNPLYAAAARAIQGGSVGKPRLIRMTFATPPHNLPVWKQARQTGGGALLDLASHHIDLVQFLLHETIDLNSVSALLSSVRSEDDTAVIQFRLSGSVGALVQIFVSLSTSNEDRIEVSGDRGRLTVDRMRSWNIEILPARGARVFKRLLPLHRLVSWPYALMKMREPYHEPSFRRSLNQFVSAARGQHLDFPTIEDGLRSLNVILAAEKSAKLPAKDV